MITKLIQKSISCNPATVDFIIQENKLHKNLSISKISWLSSTKCLFCWDIRNRF